MKAFLFALVLLPVLSLSVHAAAKKVAPPPPEVFSKVTAVDAKNHQISIVFRKGDTVLAKKPTVYTIDDLTTVTIGGVPGKFGDIKAGMFVLGSTERDSHTLDNITLTVTQPADMSGAPPPK